jgi:hypothetical protein
MNSEQNIIQQLTISTDDGDCSFSAADVQQMYDYLAMYFHRSQMNGLIEIDSHERKELKELLKLSSNCR